MQIFSSPGHQNNIHCLATAVNHVAAAMFTVQRKNIQVQLQDFLKVNGTPLISQCLTLQKMHCLFSLHTSTANLSSSMSDCVGGILYLTAAWSEYGASGNKEQRFSLSHSTHGNKPLETNRIIMSLKSKNAL